jgi:hypothetical protein
LQKPRGLGLGLRLVCEYDALLGGDLGCGVASNMEDSVKQYCHRERRTLPREIYVVC